MGGANNSGVSSPPSTEGQGGAFITPEVKDRSNKPEQTPSSSGSSHAESSEGWTDDEDDTMAISTTQKIGEEMLVAGRCMTLKAGPSPKFEFDEADRKMKWIIAMLLAASVLVPTCLLYGLTSVPHVNCRDASIIRAPGIMNDSFSEPTSEVAVICWAGCRVLRALPFRTKNEGKRKRSCQYLLKKSIIKKAKTRKDFLADLN